MEYFSMTACALAEAIRKKEIQVIEAVFSVRRQIQRQDKSLHAYLSLTEPAELERQAKKIQEEIDRNPQAGLLAGIPMGYKDNICVEGLPATCASRILKTFLPTYTAAAAQRLERAGCLTLGKLNLDEFAMGSTTETSAFGPTRNPWDLRRSPGGSSGGAAAAVAAGEAFFALGSDTGGSIRQPCAFCGLTGLKPTYGLVSRFGLIAYASSFDQIGPIARDALDCAAVLSLIAGKDPKDATSLSGPAIRLDDVKGFSVRGLKIGVPENGLDGLPEDMIAILKETAREFSRLGANVEKISFPEMCDALAAYYILACAQAASNLARYDGVRYGARCTAPGSLEDLYLRTRSEGFGREAKRRILLGNFVLSAGYYEAYYRKALLAQTRLCAAFAQVFRRWDCLLTPVAAGAAPLLGESLHRPLAMYQSDRFTVPANLCGLPAAAFPCGFDTLGLPVGMQLTGPRFSDIRLLGAIHAFQQETTYHLHHPPIRQNKRGER